MKGQLNAGATFRYREFFPSLLGYVCTRGHFAVFDSPSPSVRKQKGFCLERILMSENYFDRMRTRTVLINQSLTDRFDDGVSDLKKP